MVKRIVNGLIDLTVEILLVYLIAKFGVPIFVKCLTNILNGVA